MITSELRNVIMDTRGLKLRAAAAIINEGTCAH